MSHHAIPLKSVYQVEIELAKSNVQNEIGKVDLSFKPPAPILGIFTALYERHGLLSKADAALLVGQSVRKFRRLFSKLTGENYRAVRLRIKLSCGATFLLTTGFTVLEISVLLLYSERDKFEKAFKKRYKRTPTQYRRDQNCKTLATRGIDNFDFPT